MCVSVCVILMVLNFRIIYQIVTLFLEWYI